MIDRNGGLLAVVALLGGCEIFEEAAENAVEMCDLEAFEVTTTDPGADPEALCLVDQPCTLRAALNSAAFCGGADRRLIRLQPSETYTLPDADVPPSFRADAAAVATTETGMPALPIVSGSVRIEGAGSTIEATGANLLILVAAGGDLEADDLTLAGRRVHNDGAMSLSSFRYDRATAPLIVNAGDATLQQAIVSGDEVSGSGLILNRASGTMRIVDAAFEDLQRTSVLHNDGQLTADDLRFARISGFGPSEEFVTHVAAVYNSETGRAVLQGLDARETTDGVVLSSTGDLTLVDGVIDGCTAHTDASALSVGGGWTTVTRTSVSACTAERAAILCDGAARLSLDEATLSGNVAVDPDGAGLLVGSACRVDATDTRLDDNQPSDCALRGTPEAPWGVTDSDGTCG